MDKFSIAGLIITIVINGIMGYIAGALFGYGYCVLIITAIFGFVLGWNLPYIIGDWLRNKQ